jgi:hypothetical protein
VLTVLLLVGSVYLWQREVEPDFDAADFVVTSYPSLQPAPNASLGQRFTIKLMQLHDRFRSQASRAASFTFPASPPTRCSIHGLLNQCNSVTGTRYYILKEVAGGSVDFGHTNVLKGAQWVAAFEHELQHGKLEWYDSTTKKFRHENLTLIPHGKRAIIVVPKSLAEKYRRLRY